MIYAELVVPGYFCVFEDEDFDIRMDCLYK